MALQTVVVFSIVKVLSCVRGGPFIYAVLNCVSSALYMTSWGTVMMRNLERVSNPQD